ncbi:hypothetical protein, partial [Pseudomonas sp. SIMBA_068]|uniref:hypothetical protein n=1 Tax=Pseudomonas sp. SIMBA_068 TaxID=3085808 RepID=UPI00397ADC19
RCAGLCPPNKPLSWTTAFRSLGQRNLFGSPRLAKSAWARLFADEAQCLNYFRALTRENNSVRCLIVTACIPLLLNPKKSGGP